MSTTQTQWIKQRLPANANFSKHGMNQTADEAIASALSDHTDVSETAQNKFALSDLLLIIVSNLMFDEEQLGEWSGKRELLTERAAALRDEAENEDNGGRGGFSFIPATFSGQGSVPDDDTDEFAA